MVGRRAEYPRMRRARVQTSAELGTDQHETLYHCSRLIFALMQCRCWTRVSLTQGGGSKTTMHGTRVLRRCWGEGRARLRY